MSLRKISERFQVALPTETVEACGCHVGDYVDVSVNNGLIVLKPVAIVDKDQEYFYTKEWQQKVKASEEDYKKGRSKTFKDADSMIRDLRSAKD